jgi:hypothetical protein
MFVSDSQSGTNVSSIQDGRRVYIVSVKHGCNAFERGDQHGLFPFFQPFELAHVTLLKGIWCVFDSLMALFRYYDVCLAAVDFGSFPFDHFLAFEPINE